MRRFTSHHIGIAVVWRREGGAFEPVFQAGAPI
jgi:hypothetical protein